MCIQEAAVYLLEGLNNDKLHSHPSEPDELRAYHFAHSTLFHLLDLFAGILIMLLALVEPPTVFDYELPSRVSQFCLQWKRSLLPLVVSSFASCCMPLQSPVNVLPDLV